MQSVRVGKEFQALKNKPIVGVTIEQKEDAAVWVINMEGPPGSPYEGGVFKVEADFTDNYPFKPPQCKFLTKIFNPNVKQETGEICKDLYVVDWNPAKNIRFVIEIFQTLLINPAPNDPPLEAEIALMYTKDNEKFKATCQEWVKKHAAKS